MAKEQKQPIQMTVGNYVFELKKVQHAEFRSEETNCFSADLYVNGKKLADCGNAGQGGSTDVRFYPEMRVLGNEIEKFLETQPKITPEGYDFELDLDLEYIVDHLLAKHLEGKFFDKLRKQTNKFLIFKASDTFYPQYRWGKLTIEEALKIEHCRKQIRDTIAEETAKGHTLFNDNIPAELLPKK